MLFRQKSFWSDVLASVSPDDAKALRDEADALLVSMREEYQRSKAERLRSLFQAELGGKGINGKDEPDIM